MLQRDLQAQIPTSFLASFQSHHCMVLRWQAECTIWLWLNIQMVKTCPLSLQLILTIKQSAPWLILKVSLRISQSFALALSFSMREKHGGRPFQEGYLWWYLVFMPTCQVIVIVSISHLCCVGATYFEHWLTPLFLDSGLPSPENGPGAQSYLAVQGLWTTQPHRCCIVKWYQYIKMNQVRSWNKLWLC